MRRVAAVDVEDNGRPARDLHEVAGRRCRITPLLPTAQTSFGPEPQTRRSDVVTGLGSAVQVWPFQWRILPATPMPQMSFGAAPHTSYMKSIPFGVAVAVQRVPS